MNAIPGLAAAVIILAGFIVVLVIARVERRFGPGAGDGAMIIGLVFWVVGAGLGFFVGKPYGTLAGFAGVFLLVWAIVVYAFFILRATRYRALPVPLMAEDCVPKLVYGQFKDAKDEYWSLRIVMKWSFWVSPTHAKLREYAWAFGDAYYVLYYTWGNVTLEPYVDIACRARSGKCLIIGSPGGRTTDADGPLTVYVENHSDMPYGTEGDTLQITTAVGAAVGAAGGPSVTYTPQTGWITMMFPDARKPVVEQMGTNQWECWQTETSGTTGAAPHD